jgi:hypothetical protein
MPRLNIGLGQIFWAFTFSNNKQYFQLAHPSSDFWAILWSCYCPLYYRSPISKIFWAAHPEAPEMEILSYSTNYGSGRHCQDDVTHSALSVVHVNQWLFSLFSQLEDKLSFIWLLNEKMSADFTFLKVNSMEIDTVFSVSLQVMKLVYCRRYLWGPLKVKR